MLILGDNLPLIVWINYLFVVGPDIILPCKYFVEMVPSHASVANLEVLFHFHLKYILLHLRYLYLRRFCDFFNRFGKQTIGNFLKVDFGLRLDAYVLNILVSFLK